MGQQQSSSYCVSGKVVEHITQPRFQTIVHCRDGLCFTVEEVEWIDDPTTTTPEYRHFMLCIALLSWANKHGEAMA